MHLRVDFQTDIQRAVTAKLKLSKGVLKVDPEVERDLLEEELGEEDENIRLHIARN